jgi:hypothetical protein
MCLKVLTAINLFSLKRKKLRHISSVVSVHVFGECKFIHFMSCGCGKSENTLRVEVLAFVAISANVYNK